MKGVELNQRWGVNAAQAFYRETGNWFHRLERFPGALFDANGYILFGTREEYEACEALQIGKELGVPSGIASIPGYVEMRSTDGSTPAKTISDLDAIVAELQRRAADHPIGGLQAVRAEIKARPARVAASRPRFLGASHREPGATTPFTGVGVLNSSSILVSSATTENSDMAWPSLLGSEQETDEVSG